MDARARRRQRTHARASPVHRAYFFINASARARRSPADAISSVRPFVRSFAPSLESFESDHSRRRRASASPRVQITSHDRRARASGTRRRTTTTDDRRRPTTDAWKVPDVRIYVPVLYSQNDQVPISYTHVTHRHTNTPVRSQNPSRTHSIHRSIREVSINLSIDPIVDAHTHARDGVHVFRAIRDSLPRRRSSTRVETSRSRIVRRDARRGGDRGERDRAGLDRGANDARMRMNE